MKEFHVGDKVQLKERYLIGHEGGILGTIVGTPCDVESKLFASAPVYRVHMPQVDGREAEEDRLMADFVLEPAHVPFVDYVQVEGPMWEGQSALDAVTRLVEQQQQPVDLLLVRGDVWTDVATLRPGKSCPKILRPRPARYRRWPG